MVMPRTVSKKAKKVVFRHSRLSKQMSTLINGQVDRRCKRHPWQGGSSQSRCPTPRSRQKRMIIDPLVQTCLDPKFFIPTAKMLKSSLRPKECPIRARHSDVRGGEGRLKKTVDRRSIHADGTRGVYRDTLPSSNVVDGEIPRDLVNNGIKKKTGAQARAQSFQYAKFLLSPPEGVRDAGSRGTKSE